MDFAEIIVYKLTK